MCAQVAVLVRLRRARATPSLGEKEHYCVFALKNASTLRQVALACGAELFNVRLDLQNPNLSRKF